MQISAFHFFVAMNHLNVGALLFMQGQASFDWLSEVYILEYVTERYVCTYFLGLFNRTYIADRLAGS